MADVGIAKFGAVGNGATLNRVAQQKAVNECAKGVGGKLIFLAGAVFAGHHCFAPG